MAGQQWWMAIGGHQVGPVGYDEVVTSLRSGTIDDKTLVYTEGMATWVPLGEVAAFKSATGAGAPAAPAAPPAVPGPM